MKIFNTILSFSLMVLFTLSSCSDDDDRSEYIFTGHYESNNTIEYIESATPPITIQGDNVSIDDMFNGYDYVKPITFGELNYNASNIQVTGLSDKGIILSDFTIIINNTSQKNLGNISGDTKFDTKDILDFLNESLKKVVSQRTLNVKMKFSSNKSIRSEENIKLVLNFNGTFKYLK